ncbi:hypothetical protein [Nocardia abscessus]|uniref:hypothetical protein n=1 Tax=Nocardia abscessus TaxID=120957 RepID=UPI002458B13F|nr:hypothetical protein [Nocardia abscessus]
MIDEVQHRVQRVPAEDPEQGLFVFVNAPLNSARRLDREWITLASVVPRASGVHCSKNPRSALAFRTDRSI